MKATDVLSWTIQTTEGGARVALKGAFTESSDFRPLLASLPASVVLDLAAIDRINSCGVREWVNFVTALENAGTTLVLENCAVCVVGQLNMISNFRGNATVRSAYAPYFCPGCAHRHERLIELGPNAVAALTEPLGCTACGAAMELDDLPDSYFEFLQYL